MKSSTLSTPALGPVRLNLGSFLGIGQSIVPVLLGCVGSRSVAVQDVVLGLEGNGLGELVSAVAQNGLALIAGKSLPYNNTTSNIGGYG